MTEDYKVYTHWEGFKPEIVDMCQESLLNHVPNATIYNPINFMDDYDGSFVRKDAIRKQKFLNLNSNFMRAWLLYRYGGVWVDADCITLSDLTMVAEHLKKYDFVAYRFGKGRICSALIASRPQGVMITRCLARMTEILNTRPGVMKNRHRLGPMVEMAPFARQHQDIIKFIPSNRIHSRRTRIWSWTPKSDMEQLKTANLRQLFASATDEEFNAFNTHDIGFMLTGGIIKYYNDKDRKRILDNSSVVARFFKQAGVTL